MLSFAHTQERRIIMVCSDAKKQMLSGWLKKNGNREYNSLLKLQGFLLFYELFSKINGLEADFSHLQGYKCGLIFRDVWEDYAHDRLSFDAAVEEAYSASREQVVEEYAKRSQFLVGILSEKELSILMKKLDLWKSHESQIVQGEHPVELQESDFSEADAKQVGLLEKMYPMPLIDNSHVIAINNHYFVFNKQDAKRLSKQHYDILSSLSRGEELVNPVYVRLDEEGRLIVD
jgi:hypothetical protein